MVVEVDGRPVKLQLCDTAGQVSEGATPCPSLSRPVRPFPPDTAGQVSSVRKVACFSIFSELINFVLWTFSLLKMTIFILLTSILLQPMPLKTLAEHKK